MVVSTLTFAATANADPLPRRDAGLRRQRSRDTWNIDPDLLDEELGDARAAPAGCRRRWSRSTSTASAPTTTRIAAVCARHGVPLIEDAAEALGATYRGAAAGAFGACAVFSFNGNKIITTSGGGMLVSRRRDVVERARYLATQARDPAPHYEHAEIGYNYRLSNLLAGVGRGQLRVLERARGAAPRGRRALPRRRSADLPGIELHARGRLRPLNAGSPASPSTRRSSAPTARTSGSRLEAANIESRPVWKPMHLQPVFRAVPRCAAASVAEALFETGSACRAVRA